MFEIRIICDSADADHATTALTGAFNITNTRRYSTRDGKRVRLYATAVTDSVSPWPTPEEAYDKAPSIVTEITWITRTAREIPASDDTDTRRVYLLRKAAVLDRIALVDEPAPPGGTATDAAMSAAFTLLDLDQQPTPGDVRGYVRQQFQHWREQQYETENGEGYAPEPCGESGCLCYGVGEEHADHACGCDCPRCPECQQHPEYCECEYR